ncbi:hypothetical protein ACU8IU_000143 [Listeria innocua]
MTLTTETINNLIGIKESYQASDALTREAKQVYFIQNDKDDLLNFSSFNIMIHSETVEKEFNIHKWLEPVIEHIESPLSVADRYLNELEIEDEEASQLKLF